MLLGLSATLVLFPAPQEPAAAPDSGRFAPEVLPASDEAQNAIASFELPPGYRIELVAAEPLVANPVSFTLDPQGRIYVVETFRLKAGVFDNRDFMHWLPEDLAATTVEDRLAMMRKHMPDDLAAMAAAPERIRRLVDRDGDGKADGSEVFADRFTELADGIAAGVLVQGEDLWFTCIPKLWRLRDTDGDGRADVHEDLYGGFGVHMSLIGHDMHGLAVGPDRRLYFSIGDRGFNVPLADGERLAFPHTGAVLRCELDGSDLEVFATGLRNPQELAFDDAGNLFTGDNNSDGGDRARFVQIVEGATSGWQIGYQWLGDRGPWNREGLWHTEFPEQPAFVLPPIAHVAAGPSGLVCDPGTGLPERHRGDFLLCDFRGTPRFSGVHALAVQPKGAGFELIKQEPFLWRVLPTDVDIGPDGHVYYSDWVDGWDRPGKGRIYRLVAEQPDPRAAETATLLAAGMGGRDVAELANLLDHPDRRVRQEAQFALCDRGDEGRAALEAAAAGPDRLRARRHGIWGLGVLGRGDANALEAVRPLLEDGSAAIRIAAATVLGDCGDAASRDVLEGMLRRDHALAVRYRAAVALGRIGDPTSVPVLLDALEENADRDRVLRHGCALALARIADTDALRAARAHADRSVRLGALLALRELESVELGAFLNDPDPALVTEAARAIYDLPLRELYPQLAALALRPGLSDEALLHRVLSANRWLGGREQALALLQLAGRQDCPRTMRLRALEILTEWPEPYGQDPVLGLWWPARDHAVDSARGGLRAGLRPMIAGEEDDALRREAARCAATWELAELAPDLAALVTDRGAGATSRDAALLALESLGADALQASAAAVAPGDPVALRKSAVRILAGLDPEASVPVLESLIDSASIGEKQNAVRTLGALALPAADAVLQRWLQRAADGSAPPEIQLELLEAAAARGPALQSAVAAFDASRPHTTIGPYVEALHGGDARAGRTIFYEKNETQCLRCHTVDGERTGGEAGPILDGIADRHERDYLLRSIVNPQADIADGYGTVIAILKDGNALGGVLKSSSETEVEILDPQDELHVLQRSAIETMTDPVSAMTPQIDFLTKRELRDLVAYLASLKE